jgi:hypothetical protein
MRFLFSKTSMNKLRLLWAIVLVLLFQQCNESEDDILATVTTSPVTQILATSALAGGEVTNMGSADVFAKGVCWGGVPNPTIDNNVTMNGIGEGAFVSSVTGLTLGTTYYLRAYATSSVGTAYGEEVEFTTASLSQVTTTAVTGITTSQATSGGNIVSDGGSSVTARGVCWSTTTSPTIDNSKTSNGIGTGNFVSTITGLLANTTYYVRAYSTSSAGTSYGNQLEFTTSAAEQVTTAAITSITTTQATAGGTVVSDGGVAVTLRGVCWSTTTTPTIANSKTTDGTGTGSFVSTLTGLAAGTTYYVRAYATNELGTFYGEQVSFTTEFNTATFYSVKDATIFNNQAGNDVRGNYGAGGSELIQVGYAGGSTIYSRALVQFDLSTLPANAVIESVRLELTVGGTSGAATPVIRVHKLSQGWTEGITTETNNCKYNTTCNVQGTAITTSNDVTWNEVSYSGTSANPWTTLGGHFAATVSAASNDANASSLSYISSGLKTDVLSWIATPSSNYGWLLKTDLITSTAMGRFLSREGAAASGNTASAPRLVITYK